MKKKFRFLIPAVAALAGVLLWSCNDPEEAITPEEPGTSDADREVLIEIFKANPGNTLPWDTTETNLREWRRLVINDAGNVTGIYLDDEHLTVLPASIGRLDQLTILHIDGNELTSLPAEIGQLIQLEQLIASGNNLVSVPATIGQLVKLELLTLDHNDLTSVPTEIGALTNLRWLYLHNNELTSVPAEIGMLVRLESLALQNNNLTSIPQAVCDLAPTLTLSYHIDDGVTCQ